MFGWLDLKVEEVVSELNDLDALILRPPNQGCMEDTLNRIKETSNLVWKNLQFKESLMRQNSRQKWIQKGYINIRYFHSIMHERRMRNLR